MFAKWVAIHQFYVSPELRAAPEVVGAAGDAQNGWMASISRPFWVRFGDFEFPATLAHFSGGPLGPLGPKGSPRVPQIWGNRAPWAPLGPGPKPFSGESIFRKSTWKKRHKKKLRYDPRDLSHELRSAPEVVGAVGDAQNGWMASIWRPFWIRFCDFEFPAALAHFFRGNVPQAQARRGAVAGGRFRAKVWSHWILLLSQAHTQDRYPAAAA